MDSETFAKWLAEMKEANLGRSDAACARLLGVSDGTMANYKERGTDQRTALACRALLHRMIPYAA